MRLTKLHLEGIKGAEGVSVDLAPLTAVYGVNGSGKSRIREALELLCIGHTAGGPRAPQLLFKIAAGEELRVAGEWADPSFRAERGWTRESGSVAALVSAAGARGSKAAEGAIAATLGQVGALLALDDWLSCSADKRRAALFEMAGDAAGLKLADVVLKALDAAGRALSLPSERAHSVDTWVAAVLTFAKAQGKQAKTAVADLEAVLSAQVKTLQAAAAPTPEERMRQAGLLERRDELQAITQEGSKRELLRKQRDDLVDRRSKLMGQCLEIPNFDEEDLQAKLLEAEAARVALVAADEAADAALSRLNEVGHAASVASNRLAEAEMAIMDAEAGGSCPTCGRAFDGNHLTMLKARGFELEDERDAALEVQRQATIDHEGAVLLRAEAGGRVQRIREEANAMRMARSRAESAHVMKSEADKLEAQIDDVEQRLAQTRDDAAAREELGRIARELAILEESAGHYELAQRQVERTERELETARGKLEACKAVVLALGPKGVQGQIAEAVIGPLVRAANGLVQAAGLGELQAVLEDDAGKPILDLVLQRKGGGRSPLECLSGGEQAVIHAGLVVGFTKVCGAKWRPLIVDNLERLDRERRRAFLEAVGGLVAEGVVDQAVVLGAPDTQEVPTGWAVAVLGQTPADDVDQMYARVKHERLRELKRDMEVER